jgi:hypothetical protein
MKQAEDTKTIDMWETTSHGGKSLYRFYVETTEGTEVEWTGLTKKQARDMYAYTNAHQPSNVVRSGWEEINATQLGANV